MKRICFKRKGIFSNEKDFYIRRKGFLHLKEKDLFEKKSDEKKWKENYFYQPYKTVCCQEAFSNLKLKQIYHLLRIHLHLLRMYFLAFTYLQRHFWVYLPFLTVYVTSEVAPKWFVPWAKLLKWISSPLLLVGDGLFSVQKSEADFKPIFLPLEFSQYEGLWRKMIEV